MGSKPRARLAAALARAVVDAYVQPMRHANRRIVVIARLKAKPLLVAQLLSALALAALVARQARGYSALEIAANLLFGNLVLTALIAAAAYALFAFHRMWRQREAWICHDGTRLYRGSETSWPLAAIRDVVIARSDIGVASLRLVIDDDSETTRPLVMLPMLEGSAEAVRGGVLFAAAGVRGVPAGATVN